MLRAILGVIVGYAVWSGLWLAANQVAFAEAAEAVAGGEPLTETSPLLAILALSVVCSILAGLVAAKLAGGKARAAVLVTGFLLLATGIFVQTGAWSLMPTWYHVAFLALLIPVTLLGGKLGGAARR